MLPIMSANLTALIADWVAQESQVEELLLEEELLVELVLEKLG